MWVSCGASAGLWSLVLARDLPSADGPHPEPCICPGAGKGLSFWNILPFNIMGTFSSNRGGHCHGPTRPPEGHLFPVVSQPGTILRALRSPAVCPAVGGYQGPARGQVSAQYGQRPHRVLRVRVLTWSEPLFQLLSGEGVMHGRIEGRGSLGVAGSRRPRLARDLSGDS